MSNNYEKIHKLQLFLLYLKIKSYSLIKAEHHQTIDQNPSTTQSSLVLHNLLNVVSNGKPIISLSSCILKVNVDSCVPIKYLKRNRKDQL